MRPAASRAALALLAQAAVAIAVACGEPVSLGTPDRRDDQVTQADNECADQPCGAPCTTAFAVPGKCDGQGSCSASIVCGEPWPCAGKVCGEPCSVCDDGVSIFDPSQPCDPMPPMFCDSLGECVADLPGCQAWQPCIEAQCGEVCLPCDPNDAGCVNPPDLFVCDMAGACAPAADVVCDPCFDAVTASLEFCGEPCHPRCQPWDQECDERVTYVCGAQGECILPELVAGCSVAFEPCGPAARCGDPCSVCDESQGNCVKTPGLFCTGPQGECVDQLMACPALDCLAEALPCGTECSFCPPEDVGCQPGFCDASGACTAAAQVDCGTSACDGTSCGSPCLLCDPLSFPCEEQSVFLVCDGPWGCTDTPSCGYHACAGKVCGEACSETCDPYDPGCMPQEVGSCDASGQCVPGSPSCF